eukprot:Nk52_evm27s355 gene=Nk52_evmTU27s355
MPGILKVRVAMARDLPIMDRSSELTDAYVEVRYSDDSFRTNVCRKTLCPVWNTDFRFEVDDEELQDEVLELRVYDYDTISADDAIGRVNIDLNPLIMWDSSRSISGWFPIYDTLRGIRGELNVVVKLELFTDVNRFKETSCGVQFFSMGCLPPCYKVTTIFGFAEELVVNDDPEYQFADNFRTSRTSNEARQILFSRMSGELQRKVGLKVLEMGGNAVVGYQQCFDLEEEYGVVARGIGTSCLLTKLTDNEVSAGGGGGGAGAVGFYGSSMLAPPGGGPGHSATGVSANSSLTSSIKGASGSGEGRANGEKTSGVYGVQSLDSDGNEVGAPSESNGAAGGIAPVGGEDGVEKLNSDSLVKKSARDESTHANADNGPNCVLSSFPKEFLSTQTPLYGVMNPNSVGSDVVILTLSQFPSKFIKSIGGVVSARSVNLLNKIQEPDEPETRDAWWLEVREEVKSHARTLGCSAIVGYKESSTICDELCILSGTGTAVILHPELFGGANAMGGGSSNTRGGAGRSSKRMSRYSMAMDDDSDGSNESSEDEVEEVPAEMIITHPVSRKISVGSKTTKYSEEARNSICSLFHIPYYRKSVPFPMGLVKCSMCRKHYVPEILFASIEPPPETILSGTGCLIEGRICRKKKKGSGESGANDVSESVPFLEYDLHRQLMNKLKVKGMNAIFGLNIQVSVGETLLTGVASGTAVFINGLPGPPVMQISRNIEVVDEEDKALVGIQRKIVHMSAENRERVQNADVSFLGYKVNSVSDLLVSSSSESESSSESSEDENENERGETGTKTAFVMHVDDEADEDIMAVLLDPDFPQGIYMCNTETLPGLMNTISCHHMQMITVFKQLDFRSGAHHINQNFCKEFNKLLMKLCFKVRKLIPCCVANIKYDVLLPEEDMLQIVITAVVMCLNDTENDANAVNDSAGELNNTKQKFDVIYKAAQCQILAGAPVLLPKDKFSLAAENSISGGTAPQDSDKMVQQQSVDSASRERPQSPVPQPPFSIQSPLTPQQEFGSSSALTTHDSRHFVIITSGCSIPGGRVMKYLGHINLYLIKETSSLRELGGLGSFTQSLLFEANAIARSHVAALGGNALVAYRMQQCELYDYSSRNSAYCILSVCGDAVEVTLEDEALSLANYRLS